MKKAFVTFLSANSDKKAWYRLRFNSTAAKLFKDYRYAEIGKNNDFIVITPIDYQTDHSIGVGRDGHKVPYLSMNRLVNAHGFLDASLFDGTRYAVKRNKEGTKLYIDLNEVVEVEDGNK